MKAFLSEINRTGLGKVIFFLTLGAAVFWIVTKFIPVYENKLTGAVYEIIWLPAVLILFVLPVFSFLLWAGEKFRAKSAHLYSILLAAAAILTGYLISR